jgi:GWxTD domain-containing protein
LQKRFWQLTDPLFLTSVNERRLEHLARVAYADLRFSSPETGLRGWETDQGITHIRYGRPLQIATFAPRNYDGGNPFTVGRLAIVWSYGERGPVFMFSQMPGHLHARFSGDFDFIADNYRHIQPASYDRIPSITELLELPIQIARFRGTTPEEVAVEIHAALPLVSLARDLDLAAGEFETGMFLLTASGVEVVRDVTTETVTYAESPDVNEYRSWHVVLPPGDALVAAVETRDAVTWRAAAARDTFTATAFPADSFSISDILLADAARPLSDNPEHRSDYEIFPNAGLRYESGDAVHIYYEVYGLEPDMEGYAFYDVSFQLRVKKLHRGGGVATLLGVLADAWGFSIKGDDQLELQFGRQVRLDRCDRVTEYLSLHPQKLPAGEYEIRLRIWDRQAEKIAERLRSFQVIDEDEELRCYPPGRRALRAC